METENILYCHLNDKDAVFTILQFLWDSSDFVGACKYGYYEKVIEYITKKDIIFWNIGFDYACQGNYIKIVELLLENYKHYDVNYLLKSACISDHIRIVQLIVRTFDNEVNDWNRALKGMCINNRKPNIDIVRLLIKKGANCWEEGLEPKFNEIIRSMIDRNKKWWYYFLI